ncbi:MAG: HEAT repeat domain-containing protein [Deltaproteobacteria bacterium]|nr:HEAT repeat domain-containing protein [Deltaproteobacteria bacterium]
MEDLDIKQKALETINILNTAIKNIVIYPPGSAAIASTMDRLYSYLLDIVDRIPSLVFAESEKNILIFGNVLPKQDQDKPYVKTLLQILTGFGIRSISFNKGLQKEELAQFVDLMSMKPEAVMLLGGLARMMSDKKISHIVLDQIKGLDVKQKALEIITVFNTAIKNIRLYPPTSTSIVLTMDKLHSNILEIVDQIPSLVYAESEKNILICGEVLLQKDQEKPHVKTLLQILTGFNIKSVSFHKGLQIEELGQFVDLLSMKPETVIAAGGLSKMMADRNISHIALDQKVYVAVDQAHQIVAGLDVTDESITRFFLNIDPALAEDPSKFQEIIKDPDLLFRIYQSGVSQATSSEGPVNYSELSDKIENTIALLDKVAAHLGTKDQKLLSERIGSSIASMDSAVVSQMDSKKLEHLFGGMLMQYIVNELSQKKGAYGRSASASGQTGPFAGRDSASQDDPMVQRSGGQPGGAAGQTDSFTDGTSSEGGGDEKTSQKGDFDLQEAVSTLLQSDEGAISLNASLMAELPRVIDQLIKQKEEQTLEIVLQRLVENMFSDDAEIRARESNALTDIIADLPQEQQTELTERLSDRLMEWIRCETSATPAFEKICDHMKNLVRHRIFRGQFSETIPILDLFNDICFGTLEKNDRICDIASGIIRDLADEEHIAVLFKEFCSNEQNKQVESGRILVKLGDTALLRLLDDLRETHDSNERMRIMHLVMEIGSRAIPYVRSRVSDDETWYYLRNLAYLLGQIGNEESAADLQPLLRHKDQRVKLEALKSIYRTGGAKRGQMLTSALNDADDQFKINIIEAIGSAKCADVVDDLVDLLKTRPMIATALRNQLEEKICMALGSIGSAAAIPCLSEIAESGSFLRLRPYPEKLKVAAGKALVSIRKKQPADGAADYKKIRH